MHIPASTCETARTSAARRSANRSSSVRLHIILGIEHPGNTYDRDLTPAATSALRAPPRDNPSSLPASPADTQPAGTLGCKSASDPGRAMPINRRKPPLISHLLP
ncbi:MAG: hypothetical protein IKJ29_06135 [Akkermansia sp.]|nr:hypothetical protein [Akkermansia sp.]